MLKKLIPWVVKRHIDYPTAPFTRIVRKVITNSFPLFFTKVYYSNNKGKQSWNNKKTSFTLSWDCDLPEDIEEIPKLLTLLKKHSIKTSFACIGKWIEKEPGLHKRIIDEGHEIINHSYTHPSNIIFHPHRRFDQLSAKEQEEEVLRCHEVCKKLLGYEPIGFRTPHFRHTDSVDKILVKIGYRYSSSRVASQTLSFGKPFFARESLLEIPLSFYPKEPFQIFETWRFFRAPNVKPALLQEEEFFAMFKFLINLGIETNSFINLYFDPMDIAKFRDPTRFLSYLNDRESKLWIAKYEEIAKAFQLE